MSSVIDKDEGLLPTAVPVVCDEVPEIADRLAEIFEASIFDFNYVHAAGAKSHYSLPHVNGVLLDLIYVLEVLVAFCLAQHIIVLVLNYDPLVVVGFEIRISLDHLLIYES